MQHVLVTGASGYIGQHVVQALSTTGVAARGLPRGPQPPGLQGTEWQQGDVRRLKDVERAIQGCDAIVHLACLPLGQSWQDPLSDFHTNALGTLHVLHAARAACVRRIVYTSTLQVHGFAEHLPLSEKDPTRPASPYAASKLCGEILCTTFARSFEAHAVVLRLGNVYGASLDGRVRNTVEAIFARRAAQGLPLVIKGNLDEGRDFIHVDDVVRAIGLALEVEAGGETINVGTGIMTRLLELARLVNKIASTQLEPVLESKDTQPLRIQADTRKARQLLGFEAHVSLAEGLSQLVHVEQSRGR